MKIIRLTAENIKKLQAVEITPKGDVVIISGRNGAGKSSVLDSIWWALAGTKHIQTRPIRKGQKKACVKLDLGELVIERRFTEAGSTLSVENTEGARYKSPQAMLDALLGELSFDPLAFARMPPRAQFDELRRIVKLDTDIEQLDGLNRSDYERRTEINREAKRLRAQGDGITIPPDLPADAIDTAALLDEIEAAANQNAKVEQRKTERARQAATIQSLLEKADSYRERAVRARAEAQDFELQEKARQAEADTLRKTLDEGQDGPPRVDIAELRARFDEAETANELIARRSERTGLLTAATSCEGEAAEITARMDARVEAKAQALARASMPVEGLGLGDGLVTFGDVPFDQCSSAEQLRVSLAIAMAANPKLRVIRIQDGSLLDAENLEQIAQLAHDLDYQVWIERVDTSGKVGVVIEDGMVQCVDGEPVVQPAEEGAK